MRNTDIIVFVFTDETSEVVDAPASTIVSDSRKRLDWAAQVASEQQEEADDNTDDTIDPTASPIAIDEPKEPRSGKRGRRRGWKNSKPSYVEEGVLTIISALDCFFFNTINTSMYM
jgi:hypothetical protein